MRNKFPAHFMMDCLFSVDYDIHINFVKCALDELPLRLLNSTQLPRLDIGKRGVRSRNLGTRVFIVDIDADEYGHHKFRNSRDCNCGTQKKICKMCCSVLWGLCDKVDRLVEQVSEELPRYRSLWFVTGGRGFHGYFIFDKPISKFRREWLVSLLGTVKITTRVTINRTPTSNFDEQDLMAIDFGIEPDVAPIDDTGKMEEVEEDEEVRAIIDNGPTRADHLIRCPLSVRQNGNICWPVDIRNGRPQIAFSIHDSALPVDDGIRMVAALFGGVFVSWVLK